jgi:hypothetical protein
MNSNLHPNSALKGAHVWAALVVMYCRFEPLDCVFMYTRAALLTDYKMIMRASGALAGLHILLV